MEVVDLDPSNLVAEVVPPAFQAGVSGFHGACGTPEEYQAGGLEVFEREVYDGLVGAGAVWELSARRVGC